MELMLGTIKAYRTLSGYVYLHVPPHVSKSCGIVRGTVFAMVYHDGKLEIRQEAQCTAGKSFESGSSRS